MPSPEPLRHEAEKESLEPAGPWFGLSVIVVGMAFVGFALEIEELGFADENDPGPRAFPIVLGAILIVGGAVDAIKSWRFPPRSRVRSPLGASADQTPLFDVGVLFVALLLYVTAVPWIGFHASTLPFAGFVAWRLGARFWIAAVAAAVLLAVVQVLFVQLFKVQLPAGELSEWFRQ